MKRFLSMILLLSLLLCGCASESEPVQQTIFCMNTVMDLKIWGKDAEKALTSTRNTLMDFESDWSTTDEQSLLSRINRGEQIDLGDNSLPEQVEALSRRTNGAFDPHLRALSEAWGFYNDVHQVPTREQINAALAERQWDLGAALKGYAGQVCANALHSMDIDRAILNLGGNTQTYGEKPDGSPWRIAIQNPNGGDHLGIISVTGTASVVTSGDYQRYFEVDGVKYHHILDPETGYPADSGLRSVTIICRDGLTADCLSTALFVMGLEKAAEFWRESDDFEAVFVTAGGIIYATEGANLSGCEYEVISR